MKKYYNYVPDQTTSLKTQRRKELGLKLQKCLARIEELEAWLLEHTDLHSTQYEARLADYHSENRRYEVIEFELKEMETPSTKKPEQKKELQRMRNSEKRRKINY